MSKALEWADLNDKHRAIEEDLRPRNIDGHVIRAFILCDGGLRISEIYSASTTEIDIPFKDAVELAKYMQEMYLFESTKQP